MIIFKQISFNLKKGLGYNVYKVDLGISAIYKADVLEGKKLLTKLFCQKH